MADTQGTSKAIAEKKSNGGCWIDHIELSASQDYDRLAILQQITAKTKEDRKEVKILRQRIQRYRIRVMNADQGGYDRKGCEKLLSYLDAKAFCKLANYASMSYPGICEYIMDER